MLETITLDSKTLIIKTDNEADLPRQTHERIFEWTFLWTGNASHFKELKVYPNNSQSSC